MMSLGKHQNLGNGGRSPSNLACTQVITPTGHGGNIYLQCHPACFTSEGNLDTPELLVAQFA